MLYFEILNYELAGEQVNKQVFIGNFTKILLFLNAFIIEAVFRQRDFADKSMDAQVIIKTVLWVITFLFCAATYRIWAKKLLRMDNVFLVLLLILIFISCAYSPNEFYSLGATFSLVTIISLMLLASEVLENHEMLRPLIYGCTLVMALSIIVYFVFPDFGRMKDWIGPNQVIGKRLTGIVGAANTVGYISGLCLLALYYYRQYGPIKHPTMYWLFILINLTALLMSNSRTSLMALCAAIGLASFMRPTLGRLVMLSLILCLGSLFMMAISVDAINVDSLLGMFARSGSASEIESGTGRTAIWRVAMELIEQKPLMGWGYSASTYIIPEHAKEVGFTVNQVHNAFLQIALCNGLIGVGVFILLIFSKFYYSLRSGQQLNVAFLVFLLIDGLTEPIAFQGVATTTTLALATVLALNYGNRRQQFQ
jgi:exopolysaccharide production protein ExoQ